MKIFFSIHKGICLIAQVRYDKFTMSEKVKCSRWERYMKASYDSKLKP